jgi:hypothetical protein
MYHGRQAYHVWSNIYLINWQKEIERVRFLNSFIKFLKMKLVTRPTRDHEKHASAPAERPIRLVDTSVEVTVNQSDWLNAAVRDIIREANA